MSHFSVLVITDDNPRNDGVLDKALAPFHEYECTGLNNEYVQNIDKLEEARAEYEADTATMVVKRLDGTMFYAFAGGEYVEELQPFYDSVNRKLTLPDGWEEVRGEPASKWQTFQDWINGYYGTTVVEGDVEIDEQSEEHKWGWVRVVDGEVTEFIDRTNPDKRWDWWVVGGRWSGMLLTKEGADAAKGEPGVMGSEYNSEGADMCQLEDLDFDKMRAEKIKQRRASIDRASEKLKEVTLAEAFDMWAEHSRTVEATRQAWKDDPTEGKGHFGAWLENNDNPTSRARTAGVLDAFGDWMGAGVPDSVEDITQWMENPPALTCWATLCDGVWSEKGEMGWFGMSSGDQKESDWIAAVGTWLDGLDKKRYITVVDCHI